MAWSEQSQGFPSTCSSSLSRCSGPIGEAELEINIPIEEEELVICLPIEEEKLEIFLPIEEEELEICLPIEGHVEEEHNTYPKNHQEQSILPTKRCLNCVKDIMKRVE